MKRCFFILLLSLALLPSWAQINNTTINPPRLKVGVVLGGGGARRFAYWCTEIHRRNGHSR